MSKQTDQVSEALATLEAERLIETVKLRNELIRAARELLPAAIAQAKPGPICPHCRRAGPGSPALLRLISRLAMRDVRVDRAAKK